MNYNLVKDEITVLKKKNKTDPCTEQIVRKTEIEKQIEIMKVEEKNAEVLFNSTYSKLANIVHDSVPVSKDENFNIVEGQWGDVDKTVVIGEKGVPGKAHHHEILAWIGGFDPIRGSKVAGHKGYFLKGPGMLLNQALIVYGTQFLNEKKFTPIQPPYFMKKEIMAEIAQLEDFDEQLYK
jgi:seryl-tRNA synthetase